MSLIIRTLSVFRRITIVIAIAAAFLFGLATTVYLSLRSPEVKVPDVVGQDRFEAEKTLGASGLNFRVRATRPSNQVKADTVLFQLPRAGEIVKAGQTVAMDISRATREGESSEAVAPPANSEAEKKSDDENANENKPKRAKNTNKNGNENATGNENRNTNATRNANANGIKANDNAETTREDNTGVRGNLNRNANVTRTPADSENHNAITHPVTKPSPAATRNNNQNP